MCTEMPSLPPELWKSVLQELTYGPSTLEVGYEPFTDQCIDNDRPTPEIRKQKQYNYDALLVCKTWHNLALPMLYEFLLIDSKERAQHIRDALDAPFVDDEHGLVDRGNFVRQIYTCVRRADAPYGIEREYGIGIGDHIARIIERCPHLAIFNYRMISNPSLLRPALRAILGSGAAKNLCKLEMAHHCSIWPAMPWEAVFGAMDNFPRLETLVISGGINYTNASEIPATPTNIIRAAHLKALVIPWPVYQFMLTHLSQLDMPELKTIHILPASFPLTGILERLSSAGVETMNSMVVSVGFSELWDLTSADLRKFGLPSALPERTKDPSYGVRFTNTRRASGASFARMYYDGADSEREHRYGVAGECSFDRQYGHRYCTCWPLSETQDGADSRVLCGRVYEEYQMVKQVLTEARRKRNWVGIQQGISLDFTRMRFDHVFISF
ncbi:hypothetical protein DENSPDRAFT_143302 [Dentipellis sp. KUC8613]|nr:hypothetical protein DENSPDRAFT_143302 [Dentipellis sp. KUC8613]